MSQIKNIIFDLGGVLLNLDLQKTLNAYKGMGLANIEDLFRIGHAASFFKQYEVGSIDDEEFLASIVQLEGNIGKRDEILAAWNAMLLDFPEDRVKWLQSLKGKYRLFLFSNTNALHLQHFQKVFKETHGFAMDDLFEKAYYSHLVKIRKPDTASYQFVLDDNKLVAAETAFVDDALNNVEAASGIGIHGIHLKPGVSVTSLF